MAIHKPPVVPPWADEAVPGTDIVQPSDPEIAAGWPQSETPPSRQRFNWILNFAANAVRYFSRRGIVDWDNAETYSAGDIVRGPDGLLYESLQSGNTGRDPSSASAWWGAARSPTPGVNDNSKRLANTEWVQARLAGKANTTGNYPGLSVGSAATAGSANTAGSAGQVPWSGVTGKPSTVSGYGITDAITTHNIGEQSVSHAQTAGRARPRRSDNVAWDLTWSSQGGQPNWVLGSDNGTLVRPYNPANFAVNSANFSTTQSLGTANTRIATTAFVNPGFDRSENGWVMLPCGVLMQWGVVSVAGNGAPWMFGNASFPRTFPTAVFTVVACAGTRMNGGILSVEGDIPIIATDNYLRQSFRWRIDSNRGLPITGTHRIRWVAFGA